MPILTSRGCPYPCIFCDKVYGSILRKRSIKNVINEIEYDIKKYNISNFYIQDDSFTLDIKRVVEFCDLIIKKKINIRWWALTRADTGAYILKKIKKAGCISLALGIESGDPDVLRIVNKKLDLDKARETIRHAKELGIIVRLFMIVGLPWQDKKSIDKTIDFIREVKPNVVTVNILTPYPNAPIYDKLSSYGIKMLLEPTPRGFENFQHSVEQEKVVISTDWLTAEEILSEAKRITEAFKRMQGSSQISDDKILVEPAKHRLPLFFQKLLRKATSSVGLGIMISLGCAGLIAFKPFLAKSLIKYNVDPLVIQANYYLQAFSMLLIWKAIGFVKDGRKGLASKIRLAASFTKGELGILAAGVFTSQMLASPFYYLSLKYNSVLMTEIIVKSSPIFIIFLSVLLLGEKLIYRKIAGIFITLLGVVAVIFALKNKESLGNITAIGIIFASISSVSYAAADIIRKKTRNFIDASTVLFWAYLISFPIMMGFTYIFAGGFAFIFNLPMMLISIISVVTMWMAYRAMDFISPVEHRNIINTTPVFTLAIMSFLNHSFPDIISIFGVGLAITGVVLATRNNKNNNKPGASAGSSPVSICVKFAVISGGDVNGQITQGITNINYSIGNKPYAHFVSDNAMIIGRARRVESRTVVASLNNEMMGYLLFGPLGDHPVYVYQMGVKTDYQRRGIGAGLMGVLVDFVLKAKNKEIVLGVSKNNPAGVFYLNIGKAHPKIIDVRYYECGYAAEGSKKIKIEYVLSSSPAADEALAMQNGIIMVNERQTNTMVLVRTRKSSSALFQQDSLKLYKEAQKSNDIFLVPEHPKDHSFAQELRKLNVLKEEQGSQAVINKITAEPELKHKIASLIRTQDREDDTEGYFAEIAWAEEFKEAELARAVKKLKDRDIYVLQMEYAPSMQFLVEYCDYLIKTAGYSEETAVYWTGELAKVFMAGGLGSFKPDLVRGWYNVLARHWGVRRRAIASMLWVYYILRPSKGKKQI